MKLTIEPLTIEQDSAFEPDLFGRAEFGQGLCNILKSCKEPLVIGIDGNWGEGKTTFVKMWQGQLAQEKIHSIYIDAFANDHTNDAFMVVASAIYDYAQTHTDPDTTRSFLSSAKKAGAKLLPWSAKIAVKAVTLGIVNNAELKELEELKDDISEDFSAAAEKLIEEKISSHKEDTQAIHSFREFLSALPAKINGGNLPLTIIIDELDRCRPSFAVEVLEKIKHLFSVPHVTFVLVMNKAQLEESIKAMYGVNMDAHTYLQKFISIEAQLPQNVSRYKSDISTYCEHLNTAHELVFLQPNMVDFVVALASHLNSTLRQLEKIYSNLTLAYAASRQPHDEHHTLIAFAATMKVMRPSIFKRLLRNSIGPKEIFSEINYTNFGESDERHELNTMMRWVSFCTLPDEEYNATRHNPEFRQFELYCGSRKRFQLLSNVLKPIATFS